MDDITNENAQRHVLLRDRPYAPYLSDVSCAVLRAILSRGTAFCPTGDGSF